MGRAAPVTLRSRLPVEITNCGNEAENPCDEIVLNIYGVMGQEDYFRQEEGDRIFNYGIARVVLSTNIYTDIKVEYRRQPEDIDNPTFNESEANISTGEKHHEFFFPVDPNATYAFRVQANSVDCPDVDEWSGIYYLFTSDTVKLDTQNQIRAEPTLLIVPKVEYCEVTSTGTSSFAGIAPVWEAQNKSTSHTVSTKSNPLDMTTVESAFFTNYTIT